MEAQNKPIWVEKHGINEVECAKDFIASCGLVYVDGAFFTADGRVTNENDLRKTIYDVLSQYVTKGVARKVDNIMGVLRLECRSQKFDNRATILHLENGTYDFNSGFVPQKYPCRYRLPVNYNPDLPPPEKWLRFLEELLEPEDILTLQEYMGYCLIPTTIAQKMLIITGRGGEGKSRIGVVMKAMLGDNMSVGSLAKVELSPFARADLEHLLVFVDDDLKMEALPGTNYIKSIITAELPMDLERKGIQSYQGKLNVRFMAFGNGTLQALHDRSYGFFRRQIILSARPRPANRVDDPYLGAALRNEIDSIFLWCFEGLYRLIGNDFRFTLSKQAVANMSNATADGNNIVEFLQSEGYFIFSKDGNITSRKLYHIYLEWCDDNVAKPLAANSFWTFMRQEAQVYGMKPSKHIDIGGGKQARGFIGMLALR